MQLTPILKRLPVGQTATFELSAYDSLLTVTSRLKRNGQGAFTLKQADGVLTVRRIADASVAASASADRLKELRRAKEVIEELDWRALQSDPDVEAYEVHVAVITPGHVRRIRIPVGPDKFPPLCKAISTFLKNHVLAPV